MVSWFLYPKIDLRERIFRSRKSLLGFDKGTTDGFNGKFAAVARLSPFKKIDYIFYRGLECESAETLHDVIADHLPVVAEFRVIK